MTRKPCSTGLIIVVLASTAHAAPVEVLIAVLDQAGVKSLHKQKMPNGECRKLAGAWGAWYQ